MRGATAPARPRDRAAGREAPSECAGRARSACTEATQAGRTPPVPHDAGPESTSAAEAAAESGSDPALREIYARETASHVATVRAWIARERVAAAPHVLPEPVYRACHTLVGSSTMAEARHGIRLAESLNHLLRKSFDIGVGLDDSDLRLLADCMTAMQSVASHLDEATGFFVVHDTLRARIARAEIELDRRMGETADIAARSSVSLPMPLDAETRSELDPEIAAIFSEEAVELLESAESALAAWNTAPHDSEQVARCAARCIR